MEFRRFGIRKHEVDRSRIERRIVLSYGGRVAAPMSLGLVTSTAGWALTWQASCRQLAWGLLRNAGALRDNTLGVFRTLVIPVGFLPSVLSQRPERDARGPQSVIEGGASNSKALR